MIQINGPPSPPSLTPSPALVPALLAAPRTEAPLLRLTPLQLPPLPLQQLLPRLHHRLHVLPLGAGDPHEPLPEEVLGPVLIVRAVDLAQILGPLVGVIELENFLRGHDGIEVAEDEEYGQMAAQFLEDAEVVDREDVEAHLLIGALLHQVQEGAQQKQGHLHLPAGDALDDPAEGAEGGVEDERVDLVGVGIGEHDRAETAHAPPPDGYPAHLHVPTHLLQHVPDVEHLVHSIAQHRRVAVPAAQQVEGRQVEAELPHQVGQRDRLQFGAAVAVQVEDGLRGLDLGGVEEVALDLLAVTVADGQVLPEDGVAAHLLLPGPEGGGLAADLGRGDDVAPGLLENIHLIFKLQAQPHPSSPFSLPDNMVHYITDLSVMSSQRKQKDPLPARRKGSFSHHYLQESPYQPLRPRLAPSRSIAMYELNDLNEYDAVNHPILSRSKKRLIEEKLTLDEQVKGRINDRERDENLFLRFHRNPFSKQEQGAAREAQVAGEREMARKKSRGKGKGEGEGRQVQNAVKPTIVEAVNELKESNFARDPSGMKRIASYTEASAHFVKSSQAARLSPKPKKQPLPPAASAPPPPSLDDILALPDSNFYAKSLKQLNIFQLAKGTHPPFLTRAVLDDHHFSHDSMTERLGSLKVPVLRDLSRIARRFVLSRDLGSTASIDFISSSEVAVKMSEIRFIDLLNISSGRFSPEMAYTAVNHGDINVQEQSSSSQINLKAVIYPDNTQHRISLCRDPHQERQEVLDYHRLEDSEEEVKFQRYLGRIHGNVKAGLDIRRQLVELTIQDTKQHQRVAETVQENTSYLANLDVRRHRGSIDRQILASKQHKNRKEALLIRQLLQTISLQNREQGKIQALLRGNHK